MSDMVFRPTLRAKQLADFCHRLAVQLAAGIDIRRIWQREAEAAPAGLRSDFARVRDHVANGDSLPTAMASAGDTFPRLCLEMVQVGDQTGMLAEVFRRLSRHYLHAHEASKTFWRTISWPLLQLVFALFVVGALIWIMGLIAGRSGGEPVDILGFGLIGTQGLVIYVALLTAIALGFAGLLLAARRGVFSTRALERLAVTTPLVGPCFEKICLARLCWAMQLTLNVEMDLRRLIPLVLRATGNDYYIRHAENMVRDVMRGSPLYTAFRNTEAFPGDFLDALQVGEASGQIVEAMDRLSQRYEDEAETSIKTLAILAGFAVWAMIAMLIIFLIFRIFGFYLNAISGAGL
jgi:type II secretory pathway component PulF